MQVLGSAVGKVKVAISAIFMGIGFSSLAYSSTVLIPIESKGAPAADLVYEGRPLDRDEGISLMSRGIDLSRLDPIPNDIWDPKLSLEIVQNDSVHNYPNQDPAYPTTVSFDSPLPSSQGLFRSRVLVEDRAGLHPFQLMMGLTSHTSLARSALLRRLGYPVPTPKYYSQLTVRFKDLSGRNAFLDSLSDGTLTARKRWIVYLPETTPEVTLQDVVLEPAQIEIPMYHWGVIPAAHLKGRRAVRALIVPLVLLDVQESINLFSFELGKVFNEAVLLTHPYADSFAETTFQDAQWIARRIASLSRTDWEEIVKAGKYPPDISALITEKVIARRNHMIELFNLAPTVSRDLHRLSYKPKLTIGNVKAGKLIRGSYEGHASRFTYGDPDAPLRKGEVSRYFLIEAISGGLTYLTSEINKYLQVQSVSDVAVRHQQEKFEDFFRWIMQHPNTPYAKTLDAWGGPFGGFGVHASRNVVSGTYYGSDAKVQLVDNVGISASIGYFGQLDGLPKVIPSVTGNVTVQRNYLHVRPVPDMTSAVKTDWTTLWVPHFINHLAGMLDRDKFDGADPSPTTSDSASSVDARLKRFLNTLKEGEMLVITDTLGLAMNGRINIPIPLLLNPALMQFNPSVGFGVGSAPSVLRRTTFLRTANGVQVYLQSAKILDFEVEFNFNWWLNILKLSYQTKHGIGKTKAYLLDRQSEDNEEGQRKLLRALRGLIRWNDSELLEENFKDYEIHHDLLATIEKVKFLWWKAYRLEEGHHVRVSPPSHPENVRTLYSVRHVQNQGVDTYSFLSDIVTAATQGLARLPAAFGINPAASFLGSAHWVSVMTEAETTPAYKRSPVCSIEHHWGGWILPKSNLLKILDSIESRVRPLNLEKPLIRRDEFASTNQLQMYEILSSLIVYESGQDRINQTLLNPSLIKVVNDLTEIEGRESLARWCRQPTRSFGDKVFSVNSYSEVEGGHRRNFKCLKPWMRQALALRRIALEKKWTDLTEEQIQWKTKLLKKLERYLELPKLLNWIGRENYFFQIKISGFRTKDENGDSEYVSDSIGTFRSKEGAGAFRDFALKYGIMANELYANYLSQGY
jgi:hypothetical protein